MFKFIGAMILFALAVAAAAAVVAAAIVLGVIWGSVLVVRALHRKHESRPEQQVKKLRAVILKPGELDVHGF